MSEKDTDTGQGNETDTGDATGLDGANGGEVTFSEQQQQHINELLGKVREEARNRAKAEVEREQEKARKAAETARLAEQQEYKQLADQYQARIAELEPLEGRIQAYVETVDELLAAKLKELGQPAQTAVDNLPGDPDALDKLRWLNANAALFAKGSPPDIGATQRGRTGKDVQVTDEEVAQFAASMGLDPRTVQKEHVAMIIKAQQSAGR